MSIAQRLLDDALAASERQLSNGGNGRVRWALTQKRYPEYFALRTLADAEAFRAALAVAERAGAVVIESIPHVRPPSDVAAVQVQDPKRLAQHLGRALVSEEVARAQGALAPLIQSFPVLESVLAVWRRGGSVRRTRPDAAGIGTVLDAARLVLARRQATDDALLRRESIRLFGDSKRIEAISPWLDILLTGELQAAERAAGDALSELGLLHEPQAWLVSASGEVQLEDGNWYRLPRPYLGLPTSSIRCFRADGLPRCVLTIENRQTFHEAALSAGLHNAWVVYSAGMPSPGWHRAYRLLLESIQGSSTPVLHFGDSDVGGFRIAAKIAASARDAGATLRPWQMDIQRLADLGVPLREASPGQAAAMARAARDAGWTDLANQLHEKAHLVEQELLTVDWSMLDNSETPGT